MSGYRHELKYYISRAEYEILSRRLAYTMDSDEFALSNGDYFIRSLYFDDYQNSAVYEKLSGQQMRDKFRIRIYNMKDSVIKLEKKHKHGSFVKKESLSLSRAECDAIIAGEYDCLLSRREEFAKQMYANFKLRLLKPRVLVDYWREAYVFCEQDVRITFDKDIRTALFKTSLFDRALPTYRATGEYDIVMEVKFNRYLPSYIRSLIMPVGMAQREAISKYCLCRRFE